MKAWMAAMHVVVMRLLGYSFDGAWCSPQTSGL